MPATVACLAHMSDRPVLEPGDVHLLWRAAPEPRQEGRHVWLDKHLREGLAPYAGVPADVLRFGREPRGRPFLLEARIPGLQFNLSDTLGGCLLAVACALRIGVDVERSDRTMPALRLARRYFAACEADALAALPEPARSSAFLHAWTAKEAACKATGSGLRDRLDAWVFEVAPEARDPRLRQAPAEAGDPARWTFRRLQPAPGYTAVLAVPGAIRQLHWLPASPRTALQSRAQRG